MVQVKLKSKPQYNRKARAICRRHNWCPWCRKPKQHKAGYLCDECTEKSQRRQRVRKMLAGFNVVELAFNP